MWPTGIDKDGVMYMNAAFGDYPHYLPTEATDHLKSQFTGWMLLNYKKPVTVSSTLGGFHANNAVDESIKHIGVQQQPIKESGYKLILEIFQQ
jgi:hypothetical protein